MGMSKELREYYEARIDMFSSKGWKDLIEDISMMYEATNKLDSASDSNDFMIKKGECSIMRWFLNIEEISRRAFEEEMKQ